MKILHCMYCNKPIDLGDQIFYGRTGPAGITLICRNNLTVETQSLIDREYRKKYVACCAKHYMLVIHKHIKFPLL